MNDTYIVSIFYSFLFSEWMKSSVHCVNMTQTAIFRLLLKLRPCFLCAFMGHFVRIDHLLHFLCRILSYDRNCSFSPCYTSAPTCILYFPKMHFTSKSTCNQEAVTLKSVCLLIRHTRCAMLSVQVFN